MTPQFGVTSVLTVNADLSGPTPAVVSTDLSHYEVVEGKALRNFVLVEVCWRDWRGWSVQSPNAVIRPCAGLRGLEISWLPLRLRALHCPHQQSFLPETTHRGSRLHGFAMYKNSEISGELFSLNPLLFLFKSGPPSSIHQNPPHISYYKAGSTSKGAAFAFNSC